jgi:hypothetical protein
MRGAMTSALAWASRPRSKSPAAAATRASRPGGQRRSAPSRPPGRSRRRSSPDDAPVTPALLPAVTTSRHRGSNRRGRPPGTDEQARARNLPSRWDCRAAASPPGWRRTWPPRTSLASKDNWPHARDREALQRRLIAGLLAAGPSVVVDNTSPSPGDRAPLASIGHARSAPSGWASLTSRSRPAWPAARPGPGVRGYRWPGSRRPGAAWCPLGRRGLRSGSGGPRLSGLPLACSRPAVTPGGRVPGDSQAAMRAVAVPGLLRQAPPGARRGSCQRPGPRPAARRSQAPQAAG